MEAIWQNSFTSIPDFPIAFPNRGRKLPQSLRVLAADIGGTKTNVGLFLVGDEQIRLIEQSSYPSQDYHSFVDIAEDFLQGKERPDRISIGIAGPVIGGKATTTNLNWEVDRKVLIRELKVAEVFILNDLEANAYGIAALQEKELDRLYAGHQEIEGNAAIIAPGTGLGEAALYWDGEYFHPFATEGGHTDFGPRNDLDLDLFRYLRRKFGHVSWERVVSGPGIQNIFTFLRVDKQWDVPDDLREAINAGDPPAVISAYAQKGYPICEETIRLFIKYLAQESANLCLKTKAVGGLFIGGGIIPKIHHELREEAFLNHFFQAGRLRDLVEAIPVSVIMNSEAPLLGAAYYGALGV
ncbi:glucokinase [Flavilitoribacter nigricans DSM 23189 = NBRC 102662]|uniref:Glucokinase n=2 Tax=Flavilitoribacter TaxID=2762562 RepID=A0A2D0NIQ8_FLAN2|nr:glucokinase [Flavilitoribacter nigricans DSM 23189 = NBRC 102662]